VQPQPPIRSAHAVVAALELPGELSHRLFRLTLHWGACFVDLEATPRRRTGKIFGIASACSVRRGFDGRS
jgi:hypothetical protein